MSNCSSHRFPSHLSSSCSSATACWPVVIMPHSADLFIFSPYKSFQIPFPSSPFSPCNKSAAGLPLPGPALSYATHHLYIVVSSRSGHVISRLPLCEVSILIKRITQSSSSSPNQPVVCRNSPGSGAEGVSRNGPETDRHPTVVCTATCNALRNYTLLPGATRQQHIT